MIRRLFRAFGLLSSVEESMATEGEYFTCKGREGAPDVRFKNRDQWGRTGPDLTCSYCGSMDPDDFLTWAHRSLADDSKVIIDSGKPGKFYIQREGITNAKEGAIKFYAFHFEALPLPQEVTDLLDKALLVGAARSKGKTRELFAKLDADDERKKKKR
jgi:hypothetical protein